MPTEKEVNDANRIEGKYTCQNSKIPEGSIFYTDYLYEFEELPGR